MISSLFGEHGGQEDDGAITCSVHGVGYRVLVNDRDRRLINERGVGSELRLFCRTVASENELTVYGFLALDDRRAFDRLVRLEGIGPSKALRVLSVLDAGVLSVVVATSDAPMLQKIPGVGPKMAQKLCAELRL